MALKNSEDPLPRQQSDKQGLSLDKNDAGSCPPPIHVKIKEGAREAFLDLQGSATIAILIKVAFGLQSACFLVWSILLDWHTPHTRISQ